MSEIFRKSIPLTCPDGVVRTARVKSYRYDGSPAADTWFSVPASIRVRGKYIVGYMTVDDAATATGGNAFRVMDSHRHLAPTFPR